MGCALIDSGCALLRWNSSRHRGHGDARPRDRNIGQKRLYGRVRSSFGDRAWMARGGLQSSALSCHMGNARMVEADRDHTDGAGRFAGCHRLDNAEPDLGRPGGASRAAAAGDRPDHASPVPDRCRTLGARAPDRHGDLASLVFFATWAIVALAGTVSIDAKRRRLLGAAWEPFAAQTSVVPFAAIAAGRNRFVPREIGLWRWGIALLAYALMLGGHAPIIGVSPLPV